MRPSFIVGIAVVGFAAGTGYLYFVRSILAVPARKAGSPFRVTSSPAGVAKVAPLSVGESRPEKPEDARERKWRALQSASPGPERDAGMIAMLETLGAVDPQQALAMAERTANSDVREKLLQAAVRGWSSQEPEAAAAWAGAQSVFDQGLALSSVFHGVVRDPHRAIQLADELAEQFPAQARDFASYVVAALSQSARFVEAAAFAVSAPEAFRTDLLVDGFARWADSEPLAALAAAAQLSDATLQRTARLAAISRWAYNDPKAVADYSLELSSDESRTFALNAAMPRWAEKSPTDAAAWLGQYAPNRDLDQSNAVIATHPEIMVRPETALVWAEGIVDSQLRMRALTTVLNKWAATNPSAAMRHAQALAEDAAPEERQALFTAFLPSFEPLSLLP